jgi:hypothetical protein
MTVKELIEELKGLEQDKVLLVSEENQTGYVRMDIDSTLMNFRKEETSWGGEYFAEDEDGEFEAYFLYIRDFI